MRAIGGGGDVPFLSYVSNSKCIFVGASVVLTTRLFASSCIVQYENFCTGSSIDEEISATEFEEHAGYGHRRKPYTNICTSKNESLEELSSRLQAAQMIAGSALCSKCHDGGELLLCKECRRSFHTECVHLSSTKDNKQICEYCEDMLREKEDTTDDAQAPLPKAQSTEVSTPSSSGSDEHCEDDIYKCFICRTNSFSKNIFDDHTIMICEQCEREFHVGCLRQEEMDDLRALPEDEWFCCAECKRIHSTLQKFVSNCDMELPETVVEILKKKVKGKASKQSPNYSNMKWRILKPDSNSEDNRAWLSTVKTILEHQFPDLKLSKVDVSPGELLIHPMVFGEKIDWHDFFGMHSAALMIKSEIVCVAIFRVFGEEVAELPLVATAKGNKKKGYGRTLLLCIEHLLSILKVKILILPSAKSTKDIWIKKFGFEILTKEQLERYTDDYQKIMPFKETTLEKYTDDYQKIMPFDGTTVLHKHIHKS
ncbi:uncharacterized protein LOC127263602 [Andrographis paniculata]|uniref:uncharacterized protein LOC127263602 n=1 Tax=Andrographis paniculata TaxID=175694 RepID=UPI0021E8DEA8|nr:uncharacterized protein LOC127263602 [Andrographis paniculata]